MTPEQWTTSLYPDDMFDFLLRKPRKRWVTRGVTERRLRLFAIAANRLHWRSNWLGTPTDEWVSYGLRWEKWLEHPDGNPPVHNSWTIALPDATQAARGAAMWPKADLATNLLRDFFSPFSLIGWEEGYGVRWADGSRATLEVALARRDNPLVLFKKWRDDTILGLAQTAYAERLEDGRLDPVRLGILGDALEDVGVDERILTPLRSPGPHYRGAWWVDAILDKE